MRTGDLTPETRNLVSETQSPDPRNPKPKMACRFEALPVKAGDLVCFAGTLDHLSLANRTSSARHTFQVRQQDSQDPTIRVIIRRSRSADKTVKVRQ